MLFPSIFADTAVSRLIIGNMGGNAFKADEIQADIVAIVDGILGHSEGFDIAI